MIDIYRQRANPSNSFYKLEKVWLRQEKLLKYYPEFSIKKYCSKRKTINEIYQPLLQILENENIFPIGAYATNRFIDFSKQNVSYFPEKKLEVISLDVNNTISLVNQIITDLERKWEEFSPLFQYYGGSVELEVKIDDNWKNVLTIYSYRERCVPYFQFENIQMPSFDYLVCNWYFEWIKLVSIKKDPTIAKCAIATLHHLRQEYNKKNSAENDNNPFKILRVDCKGEDIDTLVETNIRRHNKFLERKPPVYRYQPKVGIEKAPPFYFTNSTGRKVVNEKFKKFNLDS